jgi:hypothetical protein
LGRRRDVIDEDDLFIVLPPSGRSRLGVLGELNRSLLGLYASEGRRSIPPEQSLSAFKRPGPPSKFSRKPSACFLL